VLGTYRLSCKIPSRAEVTTYLSTFITMVNPLPFGCFTNPASARILDDASTGRFGWSGRKVHFAGMDSGPRSEGGLVYS
jgi:hypothetical protein